MSLAGLSDSCCVSGESMHCGSAGVERVMINIYPHENADRSGPLRLTWILALWLGIPEDKEINTAMRDKEAIRSDCERNILREDKKTFQDVDLVRICIIGNNTFTFVILAGLTITILNSLD